MKSNPNIDALVKQAMQEYAESHKPKIEMKYGNTYVTIFGNKPYEKLTALFELMRIQYSVDLQNYYDDEKVVFNISGEDSKRANFIQKFIDNKYRLTWA